MDQLLFSWGDDETAGAHQGIWGTISGFRGVAEGLRGCLGSSRHPDKGDAWVRVGWTGRGGGGDSDDAWQGTTTESLVPHGGNGYGTSHSSSRWGNGFSGRRCRGTTLDRFYVCTRESSYYEDAPLFYDLFFLALSQWMYIYFLYSYTYFLIYIYEMCFFVAMMMSLDVHAPIHVMYVWIYAMDIILMLHISWWKYICDTCQSRVWLAM